MQCQSWDRSGTGKPAARGVKDVNENTAANSQVRHQNENTRSGIGKPVAQISDRLTVTRLTHHIFEMFNVRLLEKVFANVRRKSSCHEGDEKTSRSMG